MKTILFTLFTILLMNTPAWADTTSGNGADDSPGPRIEIDFDNDAGDADVISEEQLERKIKGKVLSIIGDIIDAADDDLTVEEKEEIRSEIKEAITEIEEISEIVDEDGKKVVIASDGHSIFDDGLSIIEALIPITAIVFTFGMPIMIVAVVLYASYRKKRLMHDTINQYVASGKDIPPEVLKGLQKESTPKSNLHKGLVMSGIGLGIFACFMIMGKSSAAALGLIPLFIGLAQLLIWKLENK